MMVHAVYLAVMVGVMALVTVVCVPSLLRRRCRACGARNSLESDLCSRCGTPFPDRG
jgi:ribosomal protein L40E